MASDLTHILPTGEQITIKFNVETNSFDLYYNDVSIGKIAATGKYQSFSKKQQFEQGINIGRKTPVTIEPSKDETAQRFTLTLPPAPPGSSKMPIVSPAGVMSWSEGLPNFSTITEADGSVTLVVDNIRVSRSFVVQRNYYQNVIGMNGALMIAPSAKVKNYGQLIVSEPPQVLMTSINNVTDTMAVVHGELDTLGNAVEYWFNYVAISLGESPILETTRTTLTAETGRIGVSATLSGLTTGVQYEAFLMVGWSNGTKSQQSNKLRFTTIVIPPAVVVETLEATSITSSGATLNGHAEAGSPYQYRFYVYRSADHFLAGCWDVDLATIISDGVWDGFSVAATLAADTAYYYRLEAIDISGYKIYGGDKQFATLPAVIIDETKPTLTSPVVTETTSTSAKFTATIGAKGMFFYRFLYWDSAGYMDSTTMQMLYSLDQYSITTVSDTATGLVTELDHFVLLQVWDESFSNEFLSGETSFIPV